MKILEGVQFGFRRRLPTILQSQAAECGLACLSMVATYHGYAADLTEMRRRFGMSLRGATLGDLIRVADGLGLASRPVRLELDELHLLAAPCILHWDLNHFVVLKRAGKGRVVIHDPALGVKTFTMAQASKRFTGVALELTPTSNFQSAAPPPRVRMRSLIGRMVGLRRALFQLFLMALALQLFSVISPLLMQWVVDHALVSADANLLVTLVMAFFFMLLLKTAITTMRSWMETVMGTSLKVQGRANLFTHLIDLPSSYFEARYLGDVMSRFNSQGSILDAVTTDLVATVLDGLLVATTLFVMILYAPGLTVAVIAAATLYALVRWASYRPLKQASAEAVAWSARRDSHFLETMRGIKTIKLFNAQEGRRNHWLALLVEAVNRQLSAAKLKLGIDAAKILIHGTTFLLVLWFGAQSVMDNMLSVGMLLAFLAYQDQFIGHTGRLVDRILDLQMLRIHAERLADIALTEPEHRDRMALPERSDEATPPVSIEVNNLSFRYSENDPWVLSALNFRVEAGESLALVGPSGCGKSTLIKLLASLLQPTEGKILINNVPLPVYGVDRFRAEIGVVMQDDKLFAGSIAENISFFTEIPDFERIQHCAKLAAVHDEIVAMSMGYGTLMGDMGTVVSGGQKQRLLLARALYRQPSVLILDEATSHLDIDREREVNAAISGLRITRIIAAHRPETIRSASRVLLIEDGRVVRDDRALIVGSTIESDGSDSTDGSNAINAKRLL